MPNPTAKIPKKEKAPNPFYDSPSEPKVDFYQPNPKSSFDRQIEILDDIKNKLTESPDPYYPKKSNLLFKSRNNHEFDSIKHHGSHNTLGVRNYTYDEY